MQSISNRLKKMRYSQTLAMSARARNLTAQGHYVINLSVGEPNFSPPDFVLGAAKKAIDAGHHYYTPVSGYLELREEVCQKFLRDNRLNYKPSQIVISTGGKQSLINIFLALLNPGDEIIIPAPYWLSYYEMARLCEARQVIITTTLQTDFKISPESLENAITSRSKIFIFSSPCNPSGCIYSRIELKSLSEVFAKHPQLMIISDEIYEHINYLDTYTSIAEFPEVYEQTVTVNGLSKAFAMTGWRIGYIGAPEWLAKICDQIQGQTTSGANSIAQKAAISALKAFPEKISYMIHTFKKRRDLVLEEIYKIPGFHSNIPQGAFYIFPDVSDMFGKTFSGVRIYNSDDLAMYLLNHALVVTVGGVPFGDENCIRISYASFEENLKEAFARIRRMLS